MTTQVSTLALLQALAETVTDPRWRIIAFMECHGGCVTREALEQFRKVSKPWADNKLGRLFLDNVIEVDALGRLRLKPVDEWKFIELARTHRLAPEVQAGLPMVSPPSAGPGPPPRAVVAAATAPEVSRSIESITRHEEISSRVLRSGSRGGTNGEGVGVGERDGVRTGIREYVLTKLRRIPALEREVLRPTTDQHFRMSQMLLELEERDPDGLERFLGGLAENCHAGLARNPAAIANRWMTKRLEALKGGTDE